MKYKIFALLCITISLMQLCNACPKYEPNVNFAGTNINLQLKENDNEIRYVITKNNKILQSVILDNEYKNSKLEIDTKTNQINLIAPKINNNQPAKINFDIKHEYNFDTISVRRTLNVNQMAKDCIDLEIGKKIWYGGPQNRYQYWPIERSTFTDYDYVSKEAFNSAVSERYWLNSNGVFFYIDEIVPLFIDQNSIGHENKLCFTAKKGLPYKVENDFVFNYHIGIGENAKEAQMQAVKYFLGKPTDIPDERMVRHPIWSTWAIYKAEVDEKKVLEYAKKIKDYNFKNSQFEIDDDWEDCYGALTFRKNKFPDIKALNKNLKDQGFRVTLWIHPFINTNCTKIFNEAKSKNYLVTDINGKVETKWWNSKADEAAYIDFTNPEAADWWYNRVKRLRDEDGIDSFKFDAGETSWVPKNPKLTGPANDSPHLILKKYIETCAKFGPIVEVRSAQNTQSYPIFLRMIDKDTDWTWANGLPTLITTLFQLNLAGYSFILPDMIGGNGYNNNTPNKEIFIRWLQANVFMPSLQFSYVPWMYDNETVKISLKYTKLHDDVTDYIMERFKKVVETGEPVNPPIWWIAPNDIVAQQITDQFLLGDKYIVAPVIINGARVRDIYLPEGKWQDPYSKDIHQGPKWIMSYPAPIDILPYFERV